ncbi:hypothetical protein MHK_005380 [Candidatus Magnetomorum sp. HK-1]|nr:hypothetical protein MHK_005380 [Candidatus Magnetomorum sp. HK-1]
MKTSLLIEKMFDITREVKPIDDLPDEIINRNRIIRPIIPETPYGCPSVTDLKNHLFIMEDDSIAKHIQSCWLCKSVANRYQSKWFSFEKCRILFQSYIEMFQGQKGWPQKVMAKSYAFLLFTFCFLCILMANPFQKSEIEYSAANIYDSSLKSFTLFAKTNDHEKLIQYTKQLEFVKLKYNLITMIFPVILEKGQKYNKIYDLTENSSVSEQDLRNTIDLWKSALKFHSNTLIHEGKIDLAIEFLDAARKNNPNNKSILYALGELNKLSASQYSYPDEEFINRHKKAISCYEYMINNHMTEADPERTGSRPDPRPYHYIGWSYSEIKDYQKAASFYKKSIEIDNKYAKAHFNLAMLYKEPPIIADNNASALYRRYLKNAQLAVEYFKSKEGIRNPRIPYTLAIISAVKEEWDKCLYWIEETLKSDHWYRIRAQSEKWFSPLKQNNHTYHKSFNLLLEKYEPASTESFICIDQGEYLSDMMYE